MERTPIKNMSTIHDSSIINIEGDTGRDNERRYFSNQNPNLNAQSSTSNGSGSNNVDPDFCQMQFLSLLNRCEQLQAQLNQNTSNNNSVQQPQSVETTEVFKVATKVPPFYSDKPDLWFYQVEAQFRNNKITRDQTKYDIVVSNLDPKYLDVVAHIIRNPPEENKYEAFKSTLIKEYQHSDEKRLRQLLQGIDLGDRKPSVLLRQMRELSKGIVTDQVLETLWSSKLPETLRAIIASINISLEEKAQTADKIQDRSKFETSSVSQATVDPNTNNFPQQSELVAQIAALTKQVETMSKKFNTRSRSVSRSRNNTNNENNDNVKKGYEQCWYHFKFHENARNCTDWCKFNSNFKNNQKN